MATKLSPLEQYYKDNPQARGEEAHAAQESTRFYTDNALGRMQALPKVQQVGTTMAGGAENIANAESAYAGAGTRDAYTEDALKRMQAGLGGITSAENQALLEQGTRDIQQNEATALRKMRADQGEAGMTGSSAAAQRQRLYAQTNAQKQQQQSNLIAANVAEKGRRLTEYGSAAQASENALSAAKDAALGRLLGARSDVAGYTQKAEALNQNADVYNQAASKEVSQFNIGQGEKELAGRIGSYYGDIGTSEARLAANRANTIAQQGLKIAKKGVGTGSSTTKTKKKAKSKKK